jgi:quinol-cytochrome oxidoreductase complex cytochrome b subunit
MSANLFFVSLLIALVGPVIAISYLKPILYKVLRMLCDADGGAEFWIRCAYLLAVSGTLLLMLSFGEFSDRSSVVDTVRRSLWLVLAGVFVTVAIISRNVWTQVRQWVAAKNLSADIQAVRIARPAVPATSAAPAASADSSTAAWPA